MDTVSAGLATKLGASVAWAEANANNMLTISNEHEEARSLKFFTVLNLDQKFRFQFVVSISLHGLR
jgi:hypothetical protein